MVLMKRDPAIHKGSWQSYSPIVCDGNTMRVPITQTGLANMDFDGKDSSTMPICDIL